MRPSGVLGIDVPGSPSTPTRNRLRPVFVHLSRAGMLAAALFVAACDNGPDLTPGPTPVPVTETFTGTVNLNGAISHGFNVSAAGSITATITAIDPSGSFLGFQLGTWSGAVCSAVLSNDAGTLSSALTANTQSAASLCVKMHDPNGILTDKSVTYTVTVTHP
jgi:hypothetical protein